MKHPATARTDEEPLAASKIAVRAYEIWQDSGCPEGKHEEHWYQAERELRTNAKSVGNS